MHTYTHTYMHTHTYTHTVNLGNNIHWVKLGESVEQWPWSHRHHLWTQQNTDEMYQEMVSVLSYNNLWPKQYRKTITYKSCFLIICDKPSRDDVEHVGGWVECVNIMPFYMRNLNIHSFWFQWVLEPVPWRYWGTVNQITSECGEMCSVMPAIKEGKWPQWNVTVHLQANLKINTHLTIISWDVERLAFIYIPSSNVSFIATLGNISEVCF